MKCTRSWTKETNKNIVRMIANDACLRHQRQAILNLMGYGSLQGLRAIRGMAKTILSRENSEIEARQCWDRQLLVSAHREKRCLLAWDPRCGAKWVEATTSTTQHSIGRTKDLWRCPPLQKASHLGFKKEWVWQSLARPHLPNRRNQ